MSKLAAVGLVTAVFSLAGLNSVSAQTMNYAAPSNDSSWSGDRAFYSPQIQDGDSNLDRTPERLQRTIVSYSSREAPGTIVIDTRNTQLYFVLGGGQAIRYGIGVGREGFTWSGVQTVARKAEWPDWRPPSEMIARQPYLPRFVAGGPGNPLGARAMYLGSSSYRIHGTNDPSTIGQFVSSGCIRLTNDDVSDLFSRVQVGAKVIVLPKMGSPQFDANSQPAANRLVNHAAQSGRRPVQVSQLN